MQVCCRLRRAAASAIDRDTMPSLVSLGLGDQLRAPQEPDEVMRRWLTTTCARFLVWTLSPTLSAVWLASPALVVREHHSPHEFRFTATWSVERTGSAPAACLTRCFTVASPRGKCVASNSALDLANLLCPLVFRLDGQHVSRNSNRALRCAKWGAPLYRRAHQLAQWCGTQLLSRRVPAAARRAT